jgi:hypothetical protein
VPFESCEGIYKLAGFECSVSPCLLRRHQDLSQL